MDLFHRARELPAAERPALLDAECAEDPELRRQVELLLSADRRSPATFLQGSDHGPAPGSVLGSYALLERIGEGGMGTVWAARQTFPRREVALKLVRPGRLSPEAVRRFELEVEALGCLQHPGIAQIYEAGSVVSEGREQPFLAMELIRGLPLLQYAERRKLDVRARCELLARVCDAVHHAHQRGVIHRDLKPDNLLVVDEETAEAATPAAQPKVLDFGIARIVGTGVDALQTRTGEVVGTLAYMSPEQVEGDPARIDLRTDVYALGVILHELLCGERPYELAGLSIPDAARCIQEQDPPPLGELDPALRGDLTYIARRALEKDKERRYPSALALAEELRRHLSGEPIQAGPTSRLYVARKFVRRNRVGVTAIGSVFVALVAGLSVALVERNRAETALVESEHQAAVRAEILAFLNDDLLAAVAPEELGKDVSLRAALDAAAGRIEARFPDSPRVEAEIRRTLGDTYRRLGLLDEAGLHLERAAMLLEGLSPLEDQRLEVLQELAILRRNQGRYQEGRELYEEILALRRPSLGGEHPDTLATMNNLGLLLIEMDRFEEAEALLRETVETRLRILGEENRETHVTMSNLAMCLSYQGRREEALEWTTRELELCRRLLGEEHPETLTSKHNLGNLLADMGEVQRALELLQAVLELEARVLGRHHHTTISTMRDLAAVLRASGRIEESAAIVDDALERFGQANLPSEHPARLNLLSLLAELRERQGRREEAEALLAEVLDARTRTVGPDHSYTVHALIALSDLLLDSGRVGEGTDLALDAAERASSIGKPMLLLRAQVMLVRGLTDLGRFEEAEAGLAELAGIMEDHPELHLAGRFLTDRALALARAWNRPELAERWIERLRALE